MRIFSAYYTHKPGGFCKRLYRLLGALHDRGDSVTYFTLDIPPDSFPARVPVTIIPFPFRNRSGLLFWSLFFLWAPVYLAIQALRLRPERIVVFGAIYSSLMLPSKILSRARLVLFMRSLAFRIDDITGKSSLIRSLSAFVERVGIKSADVVICMTHAMAKEVSEFASLSQSQIPILPNNIDRFCLERSGRSDRFVVGTAGVLDARKNVGFLLDAFAGDDLRRSNIDLIIAGDGPDKSKLEQRARDLNLSNVKFLGWVQDIKLFLSQIDLLIHPSLHEGMPNVVMEALSVDIPVLASDTPENSELLGAGAQLFILTDKDKLRGVILECSRRGEVFDAICLASKRATGRFDFNWEERAVSLI